MKYLIRILSLVVLIPTSQYVYSGEISDTYTTGDTLTASTLNNIKSAVNDNSSRVDALEASLTAHIANLTNPHAVTKAQIGLANVEDIRVNANAVTAPTVNDDINNGYSVGSVWTDVIQNQSYVLTDNAMSAAIWKLVTNNYAIGQKGPAGGWVFHIISGTGGLHGLEAKQVALSSTMITTTAFGCAGSSAGGAGNVSNITLTGGGIVGAFNTAEILKNCTESGIAAELTDIKVAHGYTDWFLPSRFELNLIYVQQLVRDKFSTSIFWSSTEVNIDDAWAQDFNDGGVGQVNKSTPLTIIAVRGF